MNKKLFFLAVVCTLGIMPAVADDICTGATYMDSSLGQCIQCPYGYDYNTEDGKTVFYGSAGTGVAGTIHIFDGDKEYTIYDDNMVAD